MSKKYWETTNESVPLGVRPIFNEYLLSLKLENKAEATITKYRLCTTKTSSAVKSLS